MPPRVCLPTIRVSPLRRHNATTTASIPRNPPVHPRTGGNPLIDRVANRPLPDVARSHLLRLSTIPLFLAAVGGAAWTIFNYQKLSSPVVASTLYSLRVHPTARKELGDEIAFAGTFPVIWGAIDQMHGKIDIQYAVMGTKGEGSVRFRAARKDRVFQTAEWSLTMKDGRQVILLDDAPVVPRSG